MELDENQLFSNAHIIMGNPLFSDMHTIFENILYIHFL